jgi:hypothetical protein
MVKMVGLQGKKDAIYSKIRWKLSTLQRILPVTGVKQDPVFKTCTFFSGQDYKITGQCKYRSLRTLMYVGKKWEHFTFNNLSLRAMAGE